MGEGLFSDPRRTKRDTLLVRKLVGLTLIQRWYLRVSAETRRISEPGGDPY